VTVTSQQSVLLSAAVVWALVSGDAALHHYGVPLIW
jgi:hypothetical protein